MKAVAELKPVLGLELTATPKTVGAKSTPFKNVIIDYGLGNAMADGVKEPAVATRANFDPTSVTPEQLEPIKLEDGIHYHEHVKVELDIYRTRQSESRKSIRSCSSSRRKQRTRKHSVNRSKANAFFWRSL